MLAYDQQDFVEVILAFSPILIDLMQSTDSCNPG